MTDEQRVLSDIYDAIRLLNTAVPAYLRIKGVGPAKTKKALSHINAAVLQFMPRWIDWRDRKDRQR